MSFSSLMDIDKLIPNEGIFRDIVVLALMLLHAFRKIFRAGSIFSILFFITQN